MKVSKTEAAISSVFCRSLGSPDVHTHLSVTSFKKATIHVCIALELLMT